MMKVYAILRRHWEYDDSNYDFRENNDRADAICLSKSQAVVRRHALTAAWIREHLWSLSRSSRGWLSDAEIQMHEANGLDDDRANALAKDLGLDPYVVQEIVVTPELLHVAALSPGKKREVKRALADPIRPLSAEAADHLESDS